MNFVREEDFIVNNSNLRGGKEVQSPSKRFSVGQSGNLADIFGQIVKKNQFQKFL